MENEFEEYKKQMKEDVNVFDEATQSVRNLQVRFKKSREEGVVTCFSNDLKPNVNYAVRVDKKRGYKIYYVTGDKLEII